MDRINIDLHIEELVLHGVDPSDRFQVGAALQAELARLIAEDGLPPSLAAGGERPKVHAGVFQVASEVAPATFGTGLARAVYGGLGK